jgi:RNA polymerase sigma factor (sigma-70 family)
MEAGVERVALIRNEDSLTASLQARTQTGTRALSKSELVFHRHFAELFDAHFQRLYRFLDRLSGDPELAADLAQETFIKLYRRGAAPDAPAAWLITVAMNLFRNVKSSRSRRRALLTDARGEGVHSEPAPSPAQLADGEEARRRVRSAIEELPERERSMLLLRAEGYSYHDIAAVLELNEASVGTLLARARAAFRKAYTDAFDAT